MNNLNKDLVELTQEQIEAFKAAMMGPHNTAPIAHLVDKE